MGKVIRGCLGVDGAISYLQHVELPGAVLRIYSVFAMSSPCRVPAKPSAIYVCMYVSVCIYILYMYVHIVFVRFILYSLYLGAKSWKKRSTPPPCSTCNFDSKVQFF